MPRRTVGNTPKSPDRSSGTSPQPAAANKRDLSRGAPLRAHPLRPRWQRLACTLAAAAATVAGTATATAPAAQAVGAACTVRSFDHVRSGHLDFGPVLTGNGLTPAIKDDRRQPPTWKHPGGMIIELDSHARRALPGGLGWIGPAGSTVYMVPGVQAAGVPWLGWNTQHGSVLGNVDTDARMTLMSVRGPGRLAVFTSGSFGSAVGQRIFDTMGGPRSVSVPVNTHAHANWVFTQPGAYQVTLGWSVRTKAGQVRTGSATLNFAVDLPDSSRVFSGCAAAASRTTGNSAAPAGSANARGPQTSGGSARQAAQPNAAPRAGSAGVSGSADGAPAGPAVEGGSNSSAGPLPDAGAPGAGGGAGTDSDATLGGGPAGGAELAPSAPDAPHIDAQPPAVGDNNVAAGGVPVDGSSEADTAATSNGHNWTTLALGAAGGLAVVSAGAASYRWAGRDSSRATGKPE